MQLTIATLLLVLASSASALVMGGHGGLTAHHTSMRMRALTPLMKAKKSKKGPVMAAQEEEAPLAEEAVAEEAVAEEAVAEEAASEEVVAVAPTPEEKEPEQKVQALWSEPKSWVRPTDEFRFGAGQTSVGFLGGSAAQRGQVAQSNKLYDNPTDEFRYGNGRSAMEAVMTGGTGGRRLVPGAGPSAPPGGTAADQEAEESGNKFFDNPAEEFRHGSGRGYQGFPGR